MPKITLIDVAGGYNLVNINANFQLIEDALNNEVLYRDNPESAADSLVTNLNADGKRIYNLPAPSLPSEAARLQDVQDALAGETNASLVPFTPTGTISSTNVQAAIQEVWADIPPLLTAPGPIGSVTPNTGAFTTLQTTSRITAERLRTDGQVTSVPSGVATTLFTITAGKHGLYQIVAYINSSGNPASYTSYARIVWDGSGGRVIADNGADLVISLSANDVTVLQTAGVTHDVTWRYTYMG